MIEGLHEITLPAPVSYVPQTIGWLVVAVLILGLSIWVGIRVARHRRANRYRSIALGRLAVLERELTTPERTKALASIPQLVKRVTLEAYPRVDVASLSGEPWLEFLNASYGGTGFTEGVGRLLPILSYKAPSVLDEIGDEQIESLTSLVKKWIRTHK